MCEPYKVRVFLFSLFSEAKATTTTTRSGILDKNKRIKEMLRINKKKDRKGQLDVK